LRRITLFAKGNLDVRNSLHSFRVGGSVRWNGINELMRDRYPGALVQVRHETWTRSDALLLADGNVPPALAARSLPLGAFSATAQFSNALFGSRVDAIVLSLQPDVASTLVRHRRDGYLFYPDNWSSWPARHRLWLEEEFAAEDVLDVAASMHNFERIVARLRANSDAPILVYNLSSVVPGDSVHCHQGVAEALSTRIRRFNLALAELSQRTGISVIDVDAVVARAGADRLKLDAMHLTVEGCRGVAEEVLRVLDDLGCLSAAAVARC